MEEKKDRRFHGSLKCKGGGKLPMFYIPSTINTEKELLITAIWEDKKELVSGKLACKYIGTSIKQSSNLQEYNNLDYILNLSQLF